MTVELVKNDDLFEGVELSTPSNTDTSVKDVIEGVPTPTEPEWNEYVLRHFSDNEMFDGMPLTHGLRRVVELLMGKIIFSGVDQVFPPSESDAIGRSTVVWKIVLEDGSTFSDVADSWEGNTDDTFCAYNTATAATRAEGRALRKALRIRVVAAEEVTKKDTAKIVRDMVKKQNTESNGEYDSAGRMTDPQANFINGKSKQLNVDASKILKEIISVKSVSKTTKKQASDAIELMNKYQQDMKSIPETIIGYNENWRN